MNIDRKKYLSHIQDENYIEDMRRILDIVEIVMRNHSVESTDFLDPYTRRLAISILNRFDDISYSELGGHEEYERKVIVIYPTYHYLSKSDYSVVGIRLHGDLEGLRHPDYLGAILGLGVKREKIGDIVIRDQFVDIVVKKEIKNFILYNIKKIGRNNFKAKNIELEDLKYLAPEYKLKTTTLSSNRLDVYIAACYNLSRKDSSNLIKRNRVKVNWEPIDKPSFELYASDMISVRGYGRSILSSIDGKTKKDKLRVSIHILK